MTLLELSAVSRSLTRLLNLGFDADTVEALPPEKVTAGRLALHLYHIEQDAHARGQVPPLSTSSEQRFVPLGLRLHYQLSPRSAGDNEVNVFDDQDRLGLAMKILHEHAIVDDGTTIGGVQVLTGGMRGGGHQLRIAMRPVLPSEAIGYWTASDTAPRLAVYYEVAVVRIEAQTPPRAMRVLAQELRLGSMPGPHLAGTAARFIAVRHPSPGDWLEVIPRPTVPPPGLPQTEVVMRPAQLPLGERLYLIGGGFGTDAAVLVTPATGRVPVAIGSPLRDGDHWYVVPAPMPGLPLTPGLYTVAVGVTRARPGHAGETYLVQSNRTPFAIAPRVATVTPLGGDLFAVSGGPFPVEGGIFDPHHRVAVHLGERPLDRAVGGGEPSAGAYRGIDASTVRLRLPGDLGPAGRIPLRLLTDGIDSLPHWISFP